MLFRYGVNRLDAKRVPTMPTSSLIEVLHCDGPAAADKMKFYGWLIGRWTFDATVHRDNGTQHRGM